VKSGLIRKMAAKARNNPRTPTPTPTPMPIFSPNGIPSLSVGMGETLVVGDVGGVVIGPIDVGFPVKEARAALNDPGFSARIFAPHNSTAEDSPHPKSVAV
jgi:hypothetical protein